MLFIAIFKLIDVLASEDDDGVIDEDFENFAEVVKSRVVLSLVASDDLLINVVDKESDQIMKIKQNILRMEAILTDDFLHYRTQYVVVKFAVEALIYNLHAISINKLNLIPWLRLQALFKVFKCAKIFPYLSSLVHKSHLPLRNLYFTRKYIFQEGMQK